jgi:hypothetical protein
VLDPPDPPLGTVIGVATTVGTVATGVEDSAGATVLATVGVDTSLAPAAKDSTDAAEEPFTGAAAEVAGAAGVELLDGAAEVAGVKLSTAAADDAEVDPPVGAAPHEPRGLFPGNASMVPRIVSLIGHSMLQESEGSLSPPMRPGHLSIPASPASQLSMICCKVVWSHPESYEFVSLNAVTQENSRARTKSAWRP